MHLKTPVKHLHDEADASWWQPISFYDETAVIPAAMAMIQPWHPGMMYLIYCSISEDQVVDQRINNQPIPAGRRIKPEDDDEEAILEVHLTLCIYTKMQNFGSACLIVHLHKKS